MTDPDPNQVPSRDVLREMVANLASLSKVTTGPRRALGIGIKDF